MVRALSLRAKFLLGTIGTVLLLGLAMIFLVETVLYQKLSDKLQKRGISIAKNIAVDCVSPILTEKFLDLEMTFNDFRNSEDDIVYIFVLGPGGQVLAHTFGKDFPSDLREVNSVRPGEDHSVQQLRAGKADIIDIAVPLMKGGIGVLHLGLSQGPVKKDVRDIVMLITGIIIAVLIFGTGLSIAFDMVVIRSISELVKAAKAVGRGDLDYRARVRAGDEIGQLALTFNEMAEMRKQAEEEREKLILQLQDSLAKVKVLSGMIPICSSCKKIRDDKGYWSQIESYIREHSDAEFSHGICPDCIKKLYPEYYKDVFPSES